MNHRVDPSVRVLMMCLFALFTLATGPVSAQDYPSKAMRFYVGFPPGGSTDIVSRVLAQKLQERLGQPVVVEQKVGATGTIAHDAVAKAPPDGHTFVLLPGGHPSSAVLMKQLPYDPVKSFAMVSLVTEYPMTVFVNPASPIKSFDDLLARARAEPGKISYSSAGIGSLHHLLGEWINLEAGVQMFHVPFKGAGPAFTELLAGRVDVMIETMTFASTLFKGGRVRPLAVSSKARSAQFPDIPSISQSLPGIEMDSWLGLATTAGTPTSTIDRLNRELRSILGESDVRQRLSDLGGEPSASTPEELRTRVEREIARWERVVTLRKIERQQ